MSEHAFPPLLETLLERIDDRLTGREALELEYKKATGGLPKSLWETVSAFANSSGGWIVLGIDDEAKPVSIEGVSNAPDMLQTFFNQMRNPQKISTEVCGSYDAVIEQLGGNDIIVIRIPAAPRKQRPVYIGGHPYQGTFIRRNSGDFHCSKAEVDRMMRDASEASADATILPTFGWDDLDRDTFARYRRRFQTDKPDHDWNGLSDDDFLRNLGGFRRDRERGVEGVTVAGLLMFGRAASIREWRTRHLFDVRLLPGDLRSAAQWDDRLVWEGNLLGAFDTIYPRIIAGLATPFRVEGGVRIDDTPARIALREALVNLLIHADYAEPESSLIFHSPEGFLFRNPGNSRVPFEELTFGRHSDPRNPDLVFMFRQINLAEEAGSGIQRIFSSWRSLGYTLPSIDVGADRYEFTLHLRHVHLFTQEDRAWLGALAEHWEEPEQLALLAARHEGDVDNAKLRSLTGQHPADATKVLRSLRDRGFLAMTGWGRGASYQLGITARIHIPDRSLPEIPYQASINMGDFGPHIGDSATNIEDSRQDKGLSEDDTTTHALILQQIAAPALTRSHLSAEARDAIVVQLCSITPLSIRELADLTSRGPEHMKSVVRMLVKAGKITFLHPDRPRARGQRYVATSSRETGEK